MGQSSITNSEKIFSVIYRHPGSSFKDFHMGMESTIDTLLTDTK